MSLQIVEQSPSFLPQYATIPIAFEVREKLDLDSFDGRDQNVAIRSIVVDPPFEKKYDAIPGQHPLDWPKRFDVVSWRFAAAYRGAKLAGAAALILEKDEATIWDLRVAPEFRRQRVGSRLLEFLEGVAILAERNHVIVETQDINLPACRLYARAGYELYSVDRLAYSEFPEEVQLMWQKRLFPSAQ